MNGAAQGHEKAPPQRFWCRPVHEYFLSLLVNRLKADFGFAGTFDEANADRLDVAFGSNREELRVSISLPVLPPKADLRSVRVNEHTLQLASLRPLLISRWIAQALV